MSVPTIGKFGDAPAAPPAAPAAQVRDAPPLPNALKTQARAPTQQQPQRSSREDVQKAIEAIRERIQPITTDDLRFSVDDESGETVVRITDAKTGDLVRQIPSEEAIAIAKDLDRLNGLLLRQQA
jgi:flagellar protein FlaG